MDYISQSPIHCSKVNFKYVLKCTKCPEKKAMIICLRKLSACLNKQKGEKIFTFPIFDSNRLNE